MPLAAQIGSVQRTMSENITWIIEGTIQSGQLDSFKALASEMTDTVQTEEPDTMIYEWFISEDQGSYHIYERYADSAAVMTHLQNFGQRFADRFFAVADVNGFSVFGNPNDEAKEALHGFGAVLMASVGGFTR